jgi:allantoicase
MEIITMRNHSLLTRLNVTLEDFPCRHHHFQADNKQPYSHVVKLPDGRFGVIRFCVFNSRKCTTHTK